MKKLHKAALATVLATMMVSSVNPVLAATEGKTESKVDPVKFEVPAGMISEEQAIATVKKLFSAELKGLGVIRADFGPKFPRETPVWHISASKSESVGSNDPQSTLYVSIDAKTGLVSSYNYQNIEWTGKNMPSMEMAAPIADEYLKKSRPDLYAKVKRTDISGGGGGGSSMKDKDGKEVSWMHRSIQYYQIVEGVPFLNNVVEVHVDEFGHVVGMQDRLDFDVTKLPPRSMAVPVSKAQKVMEEQVKMQKQYTTTKYKPSEDGRYTIEERLALGYHPMGRAEAVDAITGKPLEDLGNHPHTVKGELIKVTGTDGKWIAKDKEDAKRMIADLLQADLSKMHFEEEKGIHHDGADVWFFNWRNHFNQEVGQPFGVSATFDAKTGHLISLSRQNVEDREKESKPTLSIDVARTKALDLLKTQLGAGEHELFLQSEADRTKRTHVFPKWFDQTKNDYAAWTRPANRYSFYFTSGHQGVPIGDQGYSAEFDATTGQLVSVYVSRSQVDVNRLPADKNTISDKDAEKKYFANSSLRLAYIWPQVMDQFAPAGQLVYQMSHEKGGIDYIDALTGESVPFPAIP